MNSHKHNTSPISTLSFSSHYKYSLFATSLDLKRQRFTSPLLLIVLFLCLSFATSMGVSDSGPVVQTTPLVTFLQRVQLTALRSYSKKPDPKFYIDLSLKLPHDLSTAESVFDDLTTGSRDLSVPVEKLEKFVHEYFDDAGIDLVHHEPEDFVSDPTEFLANVENDQVREWAREVHCLWRTLSCRVSDSVIESPDRHTLLPLPEPVIIPGSRFREVYYWDSYWVIKSVFINFSHHCFFSSIINSSTPFNIPCWLRNTSSRVDVMLCGALLHVQRTFDE